MDLDTIFLVLRVVVALGVVVAVLWFVKRRLAKGPATGAGSRGAKGGARRTTLFGRRTSGAALRGRHALGQKSSVAVVEFDGREFLLGVTEHGVTVLHAAGVEDAEDAEAPEAAEAPVVTESVAAPVAEPAPVAVPEPVAVQPVAAEPVAVAAPVSSEPDWAALFARELAAQLAAQQAPEPVAASDPIAPEPDPVRAEAAPEPALVFAPRYARHGAATAEPEDDDAPYVGVVPQPVPVRHVIAGQFVAEVELMPLPTSTIPVVPAAPVAATAEVAAPAAAPALAATPAPTPVPWTPPQLAPTPPPAAAGVMIPTTAMIPTIVMAPRPIPEPVTAEPVAAAPAPRRAAEAPRPPHGSPLAGSILSPDTWRQTVDAFRAMR